MREFGEYFVQGELRGVARAMRANLTSCAPLSRSPSGCRFSLLRVLSASGGETSDPAGVVQSIAVANDGTLSYMLSGSSGIASFSATLTDNGELDAITQEWLSDFTGAPVITVE